ncbi:MAG: energy transducer TonB [Pyrinomonadaceae bacterium]
MRTILPLVVLFLFCSSAGLFAQSTVDTPRAVNNPDPDYPAEAGSLGFGGKVIVSVEVNKKGKVAVRNAYGPVALCSKLEDPRVEKIRKAVIEAAEQLQFEPPLKDGKPTDIEMSITYAFDESGKPIRSRVPSGKVIEAGVLQGRVKYLARPEYPASARAIRASGAVPVEVLVDFDGKVIAAAAIGGHPQLLHSAAVAACASSIEPVILDGRPVQVNGIITYYFVP